MPAWHGNAKAAGETARNDSDGNEPAEGHGKRAR